MSYKGKSSFEFLGCFVRSVLTFLGEKEKEEVLANKPRRMTWF
jgi:hypothetical protein